MKEKISFGKYILAKRQEMAMSQKDFADRLFVSESAVSKWERGKSYPDITMITPLCELMGVTEHELITASDDEGQHELEKQAHRYRTLSKTMKILMYCTYAAVLIPTFIADISDGSLSYWFIVLTSMGMLFSVLTVPFLAGSHKGLWTLGSFYATLQLTLLAGEIYSGGSWFMTAFAGTTLGFAAIFLPIILHSAAMPAAVSRKKAVISLAAVTIMIFLLEAAAHGTYPLTTIYEITLWALAPAWAVAMVIRYAGCGAFFKTAACSLIIGICVFLTNSVVNIILGIPNKMPVFSLNPNNAPGYYAFSSTAVMSIILLSAAGIAVIFCIAGIIRELRK